MQIEKRGLNRPPAKSAPFTENESDESSIWEVFTSVVPSVLFDLNPDKESLPEAATFVKSPEASNKPAKLVVDFCAN